jgi:MFS family permease
MTDAPATPPAPMHRGGARRAWLILGGCFLAFTLSAGVMHAYTVFLLAFIAEFGWTRAEASIAYSVAQVAAGASSPLAGNLTDRLGTRRMVILGTCLLLLGMVLSAFARSLWQIVLLYGVVMTVGANCLSTVVFTPLVSRLFTARRGMAMSVVQSANGAARAISAPVAQAMVAGMGWRQAYLLLAGVLAVVLAPLAALFPRREREPAAGAGAAAAMREWTLAEAARTWRFWVLSLVYMLTSIGSFLVSLHQMAFAVGVGFDPLYAAGVLGMGAFLALPGVIVTGTLSDHIGREAAALLAYGISIFGVACALFIDNPSQHVLFWLHACFFGITWGARGPAITAKTADLFPGPRLGTILGVITIGSGLGAGLGSWAAGLLFDLTGSYRLGFWLSMASYALGAAAFWTLRRPVQGP